MTSKQVNLPTLVPKKDFLGGLSNSIGSTLWANSGDNTLTKNIESALGNATR